MRRVTYQSVVNLAAETHGLPTDSVDRQTDARIHGAISKYSREFWECFFWPEWTVTEQRYFRKAWASAESLTAPTATTATERYHIRSNGYYQALRANSAQEPVDSAGAINYAYWFPCQPSYSGDDWAEVEYVLGDVVRNPADNRYYACHTAHTGSGSFDATKFGILTPFKRAIELEQDGETAIGEVKAVWDRDPEIYNNALKQKHILTGDCILVRTVCNVVWVEFRLRIPSFTGNNYSSTATYTAGTQMFYTDGDYYRALEEAGAGETPVTNPEKWLRLDFPYALQLAVAQAAYAVILKADGQNEKFFSELKEAKILLAKEFDKIQRQQGQTTSLNVRKG